jgi:DNA (cytosine-5)-methyltransferase 1
MANRGVVMENNQSYIIEPKLGSLFDGIGGFPLAGQRNGMTAIWASEIEPFPMKVSAIRFPEMEQLGDVTKINGTEIESVDIVTFGSPCTRLSVAGKHDGFDITFECIVEGEKKPHYTNKIRATDKYQYLYEDTCPVCRKKLIETNESALFFHAIRIIREMRSKHGANVNIQPRFAVWENVPGAFSSNKGEDFRAVLEETARIADETVVIPGPPKGKWSTVGCIMGNGWSIAWRILDAQYWGVPQRRRRIFLVADFGGQSAPEILFKREGLSRHLAEGRKAREGIATDAERSVDETGKCLTPWDVQSRRIHEASGKWPTLYSHEGGGGAHGYAAIPQTVDFGRTSDRIEVNADVAVTIKGTGGGGGAKTGLYCLQGSMVGRADKNGPQGDGINEDVSFTLNTTDRHAVAVRTANTGANGHGIADDVAHTLDGANGQAVCAGFNYLQGSKAKGIAWEEEKSCSLRAGQNGAAVCAGFNGFKSVSGSIQYQEDKAATLEANMPGNVVAFTQNQREEVRDLNNKAGALAAEPGIHQQTSVAKINCQPSGISGTVSSKWAKGTGGPAGDEHYNLVVDEVAHPLSAQPQMRHRLDMDNAVCSVDCRNMYENTELSGTLQSKENGGQSLNYQNPVRVGYSVRRLTPLECERLQDYPDGWTDIPGASDSGRYKAEGNSVAVCCPEYVLEGIKEVLEREVAL